MKTHRWETGKVVIGGRTMTEFFQVWHCPDCGSERSRLPGLRPEAADTYLDPDVNEAPDDCGGIVVAKVLHS